MTSNRIMTAITDKKEKSLAEFLVIITLVGLMMAFFIRYYIENEAKFMQAGFANVAQTFNTKVGAVHALWMMDNQPNIVYLSSFDQNKAQAIPVNHAGWIDVKNGDFPCDKIWQLVMEVPMSAMKFSVSAIAVNLPTGESTNTQVRKGNHLCRYVLPDGSYFQYDRVKGKVSQVIKLN